MNPADHANYGTAILHSLSDDHPENEVLTFVPNPNQSRNAAEAMAAILCHRLFKNSEQRPIGTKSKTYEWKHGTFNSRNITDRDNLWTNMRRSVAEKMHRIAGSRPVVYLLACWKPLGNAMNVWAVPEPFMYDGLANLPFEEDGQKYTVEIWIKEQRIHGYDASPDLSPYFQSFPLSPHELRILAESHQVDETVKQEREDARGEEEDKDDEDAPNSNVNNQPAEQVRDAGAAATDTEKRYWAISLGEGGRLWNNCQEEGIAAIGWDGLGDLRRYPDRDAIFSALRALRDPDDPAPHNDSRACFEFARVMKLGDYVVAKIGKNKILGVGMVRSDYRYVPSRAEYHNVRQVEWLRATNLELPEDAWVPLKTLTDVTDYKAFVDFIRENLPPDVVKVPEASPFSLEDALAGLFLPRSEFEGILDALRRKKNVVVQGAPGVGKTFIADRLAFALLGQEDQNRVKMIQFHQSYAYEDFIQGYRPKEGGGFHRRDGCFFDFCNRARTDLARPYVFIVDEINRGNLSKIFGELMMLIEHDKRGSKWAIPLTYSDVNDPRFSVPENVHLLGLMNTADRSLALVDYALRRRFVFFTLKPQFQSEAFRDHLLSRGAPDAVVEHIVRSMGELNDTICDDQKNLGPGFAIGHSFFCPVGDGRVDSPDAWSRWHANIIEQEIAPLLREYWFDDSDRAMEQISRLHIK